MLSHIPIPPLYGSTETTCATPQQQLRHRATTISFKNILRKLAHVSIPEAYDTITTLMTKVSVKSVWAYTLPSPCGALPSERARPLEVTFRKVVVSFSRYGLCHLCERYGPLPVTGNVWPNLQVSRRTCSKTYNLINISKNNFLWRVTAASSSCRVII